MTRFRPTMGAIVLLAGLIAGGTVAAQESQPGATGDKVRIGTFDSRALAMAYYRSEPFRRHMADLHRQLDEAKANGDEERVQELERYGPELQTLVHKQGFGTWPVDNILEKIKDEIPQIAAQAEVDVIVSKWDIVYPKSGTEFVDVTDLMVAPFDPSEDTLKVIREIREQAPVPVEELEEHHAE